MVGREDGKPRRQGSYMWVGIHLSAWQGSRNDSRLGEVLNLHSGRFIKSADDGFLTRLTMMPQRPWRQGQ